MASFQHQRAAYVPLKRSRHSFRWKFLYCALLAIPVVIVWMQFDQVDPDRFIWYQLVSGILLCFAGSALAALGMASFLAAKRPADAPQSQTGSTVREGQLRNDEGSRR